LLAAFRFLRLVDESGRPTTALKNLVQDKTSRKAALRKILESSYGKIVGLGLTKISPRQFEDAMREYGKTGETHKKVISFFLKAARYAELPLSPLLARRVRKLGPGRRRSVEPSADVESGMASTSSTVPTSTTVRLKSGGTLTLTLDANLLQMEPGDRQLVFGLIDKIQEYETLRQEPGKLAPKTGR
jgi:hypothetical protein